MPDATALALKVRPASHEAGGEVLKAREFDLQLALVAAGAGTEDLEDQAGAVEDLHAEVSLEVALLRRGQGLIEDHAMRLVERDDVFDLIGLSRTDKKGGVGGAPLGRDLCNGLIASRLGQQSKLVERRVEG